jgi:hypothetical protein
MRTVLLLTLGLFVGAFVAGCAQMKVAQTAYGSVVLTDRATCKHVEILGQDVARDAEGRLMVKVRWRNFTDELYVAQMRVAFFDAEQRRERGSYIWDAQPFQPGEGMFERTSYTPDAARYLMEVREPD